MAAVCRAGIPQAVLPVAWDQPWWAEHVEQMGLGAAADFMALFSSWVSGFNVSNVGFYWIWICAIRVSSWFFMGFTYLLFYGVFNWSSWL